MFLKRIELNGFKSFPYKKEIHVNDGITGVVGPNGSGKSNIADAMRWVLGEQSSKNLRGSTMQDVIFNGTQSRPKKGYCEVSLIFDNEDNKIDTEYAEICVRRKMYRSGESEYSINNANCRLKDILELFRDTGIGKEGYSIIGQGRIDEILNSKAVQRRRVFEEAAGIMKYRVRKEEAERNLAKTRDNIVRLDDIISELETQLGPLEQRMEEAKSYMSLRERLKGLDVNLFLYNHERSAERLQKYDQQMGEYEQENEDLTRQIEKIGEEQVTIKQRLAKIQEEIDTHNASISDLLRNQEKLKGDYALEEEKERSSIKSRDDLIQQNEGVVLAIEENTRKIEELNGQIQQLNEVLDEKYEELGKLQAVVAEMSGTADAYSGKLAKLRGESENIRTELQTRKISLNESTVKAEVLERRTTEEEMRFAASIREKEDVQGRVGKYRAQMETLEEYGAELRQQANEHAQNIMRASSEAEKLRNELTAATRRLDEQKSRLQLLNEMRDGYEGYFDSVRLLLKESQNAPHIQSRIKGVLAELIEVPQKYELAMEIILGNALQNIIVEKDSDAKEIISYLRKNDLGRVTFLPAQSLRVNYLKEHEKRLLREPGVIGIASEEIGCGNDVRPAVDFLLARTVIVEDMDSAVALMRKADYAFRVVTPEGDFINPGGAITGGSTKRQRVGLLSRRRTLDALEATIEKTRAERQSAQQKVHVGEKHTEELKSAQKLVMEQLRQHELQGTEAKMKLASAEKTLEEKTQALESYELQKKEADTEREALLKKAAEDEAAIGELQSEFDELAETVAGLETEMSESARKNAEMTEQLRRVEKEHTETNHSKQMLLNSLEHLRNTVNAAHETARTSEEQIAVLKESLKSIRKRKSELMEEMDDIMMDIRNSGSVSDEQLAERDKLNAVYGGNEQKVADITEKRNSLIELKFRIASNKEKSELAREAAQNKLWESYGLTYANAMELKQEDFAYQSSMREIDDIREQLREMGSVNANAIEDYARVKERYDGLMAQREDLVKAGEDLEIVIGELLSGMKTSFGRKFKLINDNFSRVFQELFGGGHAQLDLLDEEDIMECGIEIIAEPPGKKLQNIQLLSGGEKALTAIALLFAMLSINPSPVCLLDEIDAPLDDANLIRLAEYLTRLSKQLQFIVITHRKPTMAICDTLYGIAMHEKGVSDIVSVKLES